MRKAQLNNRSAERDISKMKCRKLVIVGAGEFGKIAYEYFTLDSEYAVAAFAVEKKYRNADSLFSLPIIDFEDIIRYYPPEKYEVFVAVTFVQLNKARQRLYENCKEMGYHCASYVSSSAFVWHNVKIGENVFIFENSILQYHVMVGNNVIIWSGSTIAHQTIVGDHCWLAPRVAIAGFCHIGMNTFIGVNATVGDNVTIAKDTIVGAGAVTVKDLNESGSIYIGSPAKKTSKSAYEQF